MDCGDDDSRLGGQHGDVVEVVVMMIISGGGTHFQATSTFWCGVASI